MQRIFCDTKLKYFFYLLNIILFNFKIIICEKWVNIIVHGSVGLRSSLNLNTLRRLIRDKVENSLYAKNVAAIRNNENIFSMQPINKLGLNPVYFDSYLTCGAYLYSELYNIVCEEYFPDNYNEFYTFGWSGLVSYNQRIKEALDFYKELRYKIVSVYKKNGYKIRIIGYSHGATLAFNLALIRDKYFPKDNFEIDELISIAMPVLRSTEKLVNNNIFKNIYHIYSKADFVQYLDVFAPNTFFSKKTFSNTNLPKLKQIEIKILGQDTDKNKLRLKNQSPGHIESWFFGWASTSCKKNNSLYPLPISIFLPYFNYIAKNYIEKNFKTNLAKITLYPNYSYSIIKNKKFKNKKLKVNFIDINKLKFLQRYALDFKDKIRKYSERKKDYLYETY